MSIDEFFAMNPTVKKDCSGLNVGTYYCYQSPSLNNNGNGMETGPVGTGTGSASPTKTSSAGATGTNGVVTPTPTQTGMVKSCNKFHFVTSKDTGCYDLAAASSISLDNFYAWNPAVKNDCSGFITGVYVCVGVLGSKSTTKTSIKTTATSAKPTSTKPGNGISTPTPTQAGMVSSCNKFHFVTSSDTGRYDLAAASNIALNDFYAWNPAVKTDCSGLITGVYVCIGVAGSGSSTKATSQKATTTSKTTTTTRPANGITTPTPHQSKMVTNCKKFDKTKASNDYCCKFILLDKRTEEKLLTMYRRHRNSKQHHRCQLHKVESWYVTFPNEHHVRKILTLSLRCRLGLRFHLPQLLLLRWLVGYHLKRQKLYNSMDAEASCFGKLA